MFTLEEHHQDYIFFRAPTADDSVGNNRLDSSSGAIKIRNRFSSRTWRGLQSYMGSGWSVCDASPNIGPRRRISVLISHVARPSILYGERVVGVQCIPKHRCACNPCAAAIFIFSILFQSEQSCQFLASEVSPTLSTRGQNYIYIYIYISFSTHQGSTNLLFFTHLLPK